MAEKIALELDINAKGATTSLGQLEQEAERLNEELRKVPLGSKAFKDLKKELVGVSKEIKNTELSMEALDNEQVASELGSVAGAVGDVSAAFVLLGGGGGSIEKTMANIEKAIGISMAFKGAIEGTQSMMKLLNNSTVANTIITKANTAATYLANTAMKLLGITVKGTSRSFKILKGAIAATGIGLLVAVLGEVVSMTMDWLDNSDELEKELSDLTETLKKYKAEITDLNNEIDLATQKEIINAKIRKANAEELREIETNNLRQKLENFTIEENRLKLLLEKNKDNEDKAALIKEQLDEARLSRIEANNLLELKLLDNKLQTTIETEQKIEEEKQKADAKELDRLEKLKARNLLEKKAAFDLLVSQKTANAESLQDFIDIENFKLDHLIKTGNLTKSQKELAEFKTQLAIDKITKDFTEKRQKKEKEQRTIKQQEEENELNEFLLAKENLENEYLNTKLSKEQKEINAVREKYFNLIEQAKLYGDDTTILEEAQQSRINEIQQKYADEEVQRAKDVENAKLQSASDTLNALMKLNNSFAAEELDLSEQKKIAEENEDKEELKRLIALEQANEIIRKKAFERNKKLQIAQALIQTYQSANAAFASAAANPVTTLFPAFPGIMASLAVAAGLANVNNIRKQKFQSSSAGTSPSVSLPGIPTGNAGEDAPTIGPANTSTLIGQEPQRVFVTETDITNTQNNVAVIEGQSTFGN